MHVELLANNTTWRKDLLSSAWGVGKMNCVTVEIARLTNIVKGIELRVTKETDRIESDDRDRVR